MAINKKLIHFKNKENFDTEVANGNILDTSICFILDTKEIYTHGTLYDCSYKNSNNSIDWGYLKTEWVDMGLPSGTLWKSYNLGANNMDEIGLMYEWGDTLGYEIIITGEEASDNSFYETNVTYITNPEGKRFYNQTTSKWYNGNYDGPNYYTKYTRDDGLTELELIDDAAYQVDNSTRIPSLADWQELLNNCTVTLTDTGYYLTSNINNARLYFVNGYETSFLGYDVLHKSGGFYMSREVRYSENDWDMYDYGDLVWTDWISPIELAADEGAGIILSYRFRGCYIRPVKYVE